MSPMTFYDIIGKLVLGFILDNEQQDVILNHGIVETDGLTIWYVCDKGRFESITASNIVDIGLTLGALRLRETTTTP